MHLIEKRKPIRILHVLHSFDVGGLENGVVNLINHMDRSSFSHAICSITRMGKLANRLNQKDIELIELGKSAGQDWALPFRLARLFKKMEPDIVHTRNWGTIDGIVGARLSRIPIVIHGEHGRTMEEVDRVNRKRKIVRRILQPFVDRFVTVSWELRDWLCATMGISEKKIKVICNGVDSEKFCPPLDKNAIRLRYGFRKDEFLIGTVGRLDPVKDHETLIRTIPLLKDRFPNVRLLIIGGGACYSQILGLVEALGLKKQVILFGERDDVSSLMQIMDLFVLNSLSEGISNTILEAMATGLPVVASNVGGNLELVLEGETGYLIPARSIDALRKAIDSYLVNHGKADQHGAAARQRIEEKFSLHKMILSYERFYRALARHKLNEGRV